MVEADQDLTLAEARTMWLTVKQPSLLLVRVGYVPAKPGCWHDSMGHSSRYPHPRNPG